MRLPRSLVIVLSVLLTACAPAQRNVVVTDAPTIASIVTVAPTAIPSPIPSPTPTPTRLSLIYAVENDGLYFLNGETAKRVIASREAVTPFLSPDGKRIAFARSVRKANGQLTAEQLYVADADGSRSQIARDGTNRLIGWANNSTVLFTTFKVSQAMGYCLSGDLWKMDVESEQAKQLMPALANERTFFPSPDGKWIAVITGAQVDLISADGAARQEKIATVPELPGYCGRSTIPIVWATDSTSFFVPTGKAEATEWSLTQVSTSGTVSPLWNIPTPGNTLASDIVFIAPDGQRLVMQRNGQASLLSRQDKPLILSGELRGGAWSPDSKIFIHVGIGKVFSVSLDGTTKQFGGEIKNPNVLRWAGAQVILDSFINNERALYAYAPLDDTLTTLAKFNIERVNCGNAGTRLIKGEKASVWTRRIPTTCGAQRAAARHWWGRSRRAKR